MPVKDAYLHNNAVATLSAVKPGTAGLQVRTARIAPINFNDAATTLLIQVLELNIDLALDPATQTVTATYTGTTNGHTGNYCSPSGSAHGTLSVVYSIGDPGGGHVELYRHSNFAGIVVQCHTNRPLQEYRAPLSLDVWQRATHVFVPHHTAVSAAAC